MPTYSLRIRRSTYAIPGATSDAIAACVPNPQCECNTPSHPPIIPDEDCNPNYSHSTVGLTCDWTYPDDTDCIPVWFFQNVIDVYSHGCPTIPPDSPLDELCVTNADGSISWCCLVECMRRFIDRKGESDCITEEDLADEFITNPHCERAWGAALLLWGAHGAAIHLAHCLGVPFPLLPGQVNFTNPTYTIGSNGPLVHMKSIELPPGSRLISRECIDIPIGPNCECPPLLS